VAQFEVGYPSVTTDQTVSVPLVQPYSIDYPALLLRLWLGAMGILHGFPKVFGGMEKFTEGVVKMGLPAPEFFAWAAALSEFAGGILLVLGLGTRVSAFLMAATMAVAGFIRHAEDPFKTKELALCYLVLSVVIFLLGPGRISLDALLFRRRGV
jgi:putative oxidoreductase